PQLHPPFLLSLLLSPPLPLPLRPSLPRPACRRRPSFRRRGPSAVACAPRRRGLLTAAAPDFATASPSRRRTFAQPPAPLSPSLPAP
ncbi:unnamed protein product, partial [Closterium sp. Naga37s-1]